MTLHSANPSPRAQTGHSESKDSTSDAFALATRCNFVVGGLVGLATTVFGPGCAQHRQHTTVGNTFVGSAHGQLMATASVPNQAQPRDPRSQEHTKQLDGARAQAMHKQLPVSIFHSSVGLNSACVQGSTGGEIVVGGERGAHAQFSVRCSDGSRGTIVLADLEAWGKAATRELQDKGFRGPVFVEPFTRHVYRVEERLAPQDVNRSLEYDRIPVELSLPAFRFR